MKFIKSQTNQFQKSPSFYPVATFHEFTTEALDQATNGAWVVRGKRSSDLYDPILSTWDTQEGAEESLKQLITKLADEKGGASIIYAWPPHYGEAPKKGGKPADLT